MSHFIFELADYIHHDPENPFNKETIDQDIYKAQLVCLLADWGENYIDRVWKFAADYSDIVHLEKRHE